MTEILHDKSVYKYIFQVVFTSGKFPRQTLVASRLINQTKYGNFFLFVSSCNINEVDPNHQTSKLLGHLVYHIPKVKIVKNLQRTSQGYTT